MSSTCSIKVITQLVKGNLFNQSNYKVLSFLTISWLRETLSYNELRQIVLISFNPFSANITKWSDILKQFVDKLERNCFSVFNHFVGLVLKALSEVSCLRCCLSILKSELHLGVLVLYVIYCSLAKDIAVLINGTYKIA